MSCYSSVVAAAEAAWRDPRRVLLPVALRDAVLLVVVSREVAIVVPAAHLPR